MRQGIAGNLVIRTYAQVHTDRSGLFQNETEAHSEMFNSAQTSDGHEITKVAGPHQETEKSRNLHFARAEIYEEQHER